MTIAWQQELDAERDRLLDFGTRCVHPAGGAAWLLEDGRPDLTRPRATWITARMVHVYSIGALQGRDSDAAIASGVLAGLLGDLRDERRGGWFDEIAADGTRPEGKSCYQHAFVALAACSAVTAGLPGGEQLLDEAVQALARFEDAQGLVADRCDDSWQHDDDYRGLNALMHAVEAYLALWDLTGDRRWLERAGRGTDLVTSLAREHDGRLPEHFDGRWIPDLERNADRPDDPFKPFGATVGHALEWSRLLLQVEVAAGGRPMLRATARGLFERAVSDGWAVDGAPGFVYTTDWEGRPVVRDRMHWVVAEAISAAVVLGRRTGDPAPLDRAREWWQYVRDRVIDPAGSWRHQLDPALQPARTVWPGSPDLYHAVTTTLVPSIPLGVGLPAGLLRGSDVADAVDTGP